MRQCWQLAVTNHPRARISAIVTADMGEGGGETVSGSREPICHWTVTRPLRTRRRSAAMLRRRRAPGWAASISRSTAPRPARPSADVRSTAATILSISAAPSASARGEPGSSDIFSSSIPSHVRGGIGALARTDLRAGTRTTGPIGRPAGRRPALARGVTPNRAIGLPAMKSSTFVPVPKRTARALRCRACAKLLALASDTFRGPLDIKCGRCKTDNRFTERPRAPSDQEGACPKGPQGQPTS